MTNPTPTPAGSHAYAYWLADKLPALGDYAKEAAFLLRMQADEILRFKTESAAPGSQTKAADE